MDKLTQLTKDLNILETATGQLNTTRANHAAVAQALRNLGDFVTEQLSEPKPAPAPLKA